MAPGLPGEESLCPTPLCRAPRRADARFCYRCGRMLAPPPAPSQARSARKLLIMLLAVWAAVSPYVLARTRMLGLTIWTVAGVWLAVELGRYKTGSGRREGRQPQLPERQP